MATGGGVFWSVKAAVCQRGKRTSKGSTEKFFQGKITHTQHKAGEFSATPKRAKRGQAKRGTTEETKGTFSERNHSKGGMVTRGRQGMTQGETPLNWVGGPGKFSWQVSGPLCSGRGMLKRLSGQKEFAWLGRMEKRGGERVGESTP